MNTLKYIVGILLIGFIFGCNDQWDKHYQAEVATVNENVWNAAQQDTSISKFVTLVKKYAFDTLFLTDKTYTLFIPNNTALANFIDSGDNAKALLRYNISEFFVSSHHIEGMRKIQTLGEKYALFFRSGANVMFDGVPLTYESPLYLNGKYFKMETLALPKYNLYEYFAIYNPVLKEFIDEQDTLILDKEKSRPLGFDDFGNTIYDTVATMENIFEYEFFPVKHELRYKTATFVFPKSDDYNAALTEMAQKLGGSFTDYRDIPKAWQNKYLIPYLLKQGVFENMLEPSEFVLDPLKNDTLRLKNILGDSVDINYTVGEKTLCSNGYAYNYQNFKVPDTLWASRQRFEAEKLLRNIAVGKWTWKPGVTVNYATNYPPLLDVNPVYASEDTFLRVSYASTYTGTYSVEFNIDFLFPRKYLMVMRTNYTYGGKYNIYVNDVLVKYIDYYSFRNGFYDSPDSKIRYFRDAGRLFISFDCWINNLTEYGKTKIKFEYKGISPGVRPALTLDYIDFIPY